MITSGRHECYEILSWHFANENYRFFFYNQIQISESIKVFRIDIPRNKPFDAPELCFHAIDDFNSDNLS